MHKLIIALIAGTFAAVAVAQRPAPMTDEDRAKCADFVTAKTGGYADCEGKVEVRRPFTAGGAEGAGTSAQADAKASAEAPR